MDETKRSGMRPIEVIVLVGACLLLGSLLLAVLEPGKREAGRRAQCMNNQRQIALGMLNFEGAKGRFPGYKEHLCTKTSGEVVEASWVVMLLPYMEHSDLYNHWQNPEKNRRVRLDAPRAPAMRGSDGPESYAAHGASRRTLLV